MYQRALVIAAADHGMSFRPGLPPRDPTTTTLADIAAVPLFVKYPGERTGRVDPRNARTTDILPTIADVIGVTMPWKVDGVPLRGASRGRPVVVENFNGETVTASPDAVEAGVLATARRNAALFGVGSDSLYRIGPHQDLIGKSVDGLRRGTVTETDVRLHDARGFETVREALGLRSRPRRGRDPGAWGGQRHATGDCGQRTHCSVHKSVPPRRRDPLRKPRSGSVPQRRAQRCGDLQRPQHGHRHRAGPG